MEGDEFESKEDHLIDLLSSSSSSSSMRNSEDKTDKTSTESDALRKSYYHTVRCGTGVRCEHVIELLCAKVFIDDKDDDDDGVVVFGDIKIVNNPPSQLPMDIIIYNRASRIYTHRNFLQLSTPDEIPNLVQPSIFVDIKNFNTGDVIVSGSKRLLKTTDSPSLNPPFENISTLTFHGDGGRVELQYAALTYGVYAEVEMILCKDVDDDDDHVQGVEIFGMISAKSNLLFSPEECYENHIFNVIEEERVWVQLGTEIPLFKNLVALPAYSDLEISVNMLASEDDAFIVQGTACFQPMNSFVDWKDIRGLNGFYVEVRVAFCEPSFLNQPFDHVDRVPYLCCVPRFPQIYASQILEVFSLFIARPNCKEVNLYGTVKIIDPDGCCTIFSCSKNEAYFLSRDCNILPMQGPKRVVTPAELFSIQIDLSDVDGHVKIKGLVLHDRNMENLRKPCFDRRLCSVVGGANKNSFAAVYYTSFSSAVQANLTVRHECKRRSSGCVKIYGDVIALYPKLVTTNYYKKFFQIKLFTRNEVNPLEGVENFELSRTFLAVPIDFILQMKVDLYFQTSEGTHHVKKIKSLQIGEPCVAIESDDVNIFIDVMWKGLPYVSHEC